MGQTNAFNWLEWNVAGFQRLSQEERDAISGFVFLWSLFEAKALNTNASSKAMFQLVHGWERQGKLNICDYSSSLQYFRERYYRNGDFTDYYDGLFLRSNDMPELVASVIMSANTDPADCVTALLIVVYRLKNNLFHGLKWVDEIQGQQGNFEHANKVLETAISTVIGL